MDVDATLDAIKLEARKELARRDFWEYSKLKYPKHYKDERHYLRVICQRMQRFVETSRKHFLIITVPPRHYKSFSGTNFVEWTFGKDPERKVMTGSYNETLSTTFASKVRNTIDERKIEGGPLVYNDIFPATKIKYGEAAAALWSLAGQTQKSYLATSPGGTATGFGANIVIIDDIIKNAKEAYNEMILEGHWDWLTNTMIQRVEGDDWKFIIIMTRWALGDLAGRVLDEFPDDVEEISFSAIQKDGSMLEPSVLSRGSYDVKTKNMNPDIRDANYNQKPVDVSGRLYSAFAEWERLPSGKFKKRNYTDTADKGTDFLCSVDFMDDGQFVYVTDVVMSDAAMEVTEPLVANMLDADQVEEAEFESNNGGRGYSRNIDRLLKEKGNRRCVVKDTPQSQNKEARILASSAWVQRNVMMPLNWKKRFPEFYKQVMNYQRKGKNAHDDAPDVLAAIYERVANPDEPVFRVRSA